MKRYYISLLALTAVLVLASFALLWCGGEFLMIMPIIALYFGVITGLEHWAIVASMRKSPRDFIKNFLGITMGVLFLHLMVIGIWMFTHLKDPHNAKIALIAFSVCYVVHLVYETVALALFVKREGKEKEKIEEK
ncbi:MAG: hypothetical protein IJL38_06645 [Bacteroidales bacterium]|nr:hypothetical protein [Bacteroidales bacterium]